MRIIDKIKKNWCNFWNKRKIELEIIRHQTINHILFLHRHNFIISIWYLIIFLGVFISCVCNWNEISDIKFNPPSKYSLLFIWLIILSLIPFGNGEILGIKFQSNNSLNNPSCEPISKDDIEARNRMIEEKRNELNNLSKQSEVKNVQ